MQKYLLLPWLTVSCLARIRKKMENLKSMNSMHVYCACSTMQHWQSTVPNSRVSLWKSRIHCHMALCSISGDGGGPGLTDIAAGQPNEWTTELPTRKQAQRKAPETSPGDFHQTTQNDESNRINHINRIWKDHSGPEMPCSTSHCSRCFRITSLQSFCDSVVGQTPPPCKAPRLSSVPGRRVWTVQGELSEFKSEIWSPKTHLSMEMVNQIVR